MTQGRSSGPWHSFGPSGHLPRQERFQGHPAIPFQGRNPSNQGRASNFGRRNVPQQPARQGGLLAKFKGKNSQNQKPNHLFAPPSGERGTSAGGGAAGFIETLKNPNALSGMLENTQKVLQAAEKVTPLVQQYGPIIKNIPSMWKIYQGLNSTDSQTTEKKSTEHQEKEPSEKHDPVVEPKKKKKKTGTSAPKLFI